MYSASNIIKVNLNLTPGGLGAADFNTILFFGKVGDLEGTSSLVADDTKDYVDLDGVADDWGTDTPVYYAASRWFANPVRPDTFTVWVWDDAVDTTPVSVLTKANQSALWRYWIAFPKATTDTAGEAINIAEYIEATDHAFSFIGSSVDLEDTQATSTVADDLKAAGVRRTWMGYRTTDTLSTSPSNAYANLQLQAAFAKFNFDGQNTALTGEFQVLPGVIGESLSTSAYQSLKDKNVVFWTQVELKGQTDASRTINTRTFSSFNEYIDDLYLLDVLKNRAQVAGYNYMANAGNKRSLTPKGYAGLLAEFSRIFRQGYINGTLGRGTYNDPVDGEEKTAENGFVIFSDAADALSLTATQENDRLYPPVQSRVLLARAGHGADLTINVE